MEFDFDLSFQSKQADHLHRLEQLCYRIRLAEYVEHLRPREELKPSLMVSEVYNLVLEHSYTLHDKPYHHCV